MTTSVCLSTVSLFSYLCNGYGYGIYIAAITSVSYRFRNYVGTFESFVAVAMMVATCVLSRLMVMRESSAPQFKVERRSLSSKRCTPLTPLKKWSAVVMTLLLAV